MLRRLKRLATTSVAKRQKNIRQHSIGIPMGQQPKRFPKCPTANPPKQFYIMRFGLAGALPIMPMHRKPFIG